ncbi:DNA-binding transcriptional regulator, LysR family [Treponema bryantii]|uniref:DNA-binding transcriptional regulator, LysR family n=1 Tax=Treponema bryantii TaxID=163 RepID=A0A1I3JVC8_9SPIR|nr:LysR family transcriptional regulator [Treponema bryantii]SFI64134.1 DNA-binding transcriptional regulator, LysR family [Treponema bryantii]
MTLQQLKYAVAVADTHNITEASRRVFVSQPSLTAAIRELEAEMGITIFSRSNKGVSVTNEGDEFLSYARQVLEQATLLEDRFKSDGAASGNTIFSVSCQHYSFAVNAFVDVIRMFGGNEYNFTLRETQTHEIIEDVAHLKSEIGVLYLSNRNENVITKLIKKNNLTFEPLFTAPLHIFISKKNLLAKKKKIKLSDLATFPYLTYEQGDFNSFYYAEEPLTEIDFECSKSIQVRDRATLFNLLIGLDGFTICSGIISHELNGPEIISRPLDCKEHMTVGYITRKAMNLSRYATAYIEALKKHSNT